MPKNQIKATRAKQREENKMVNDVELSVEHRWISLTKKRGD